MLTVFKKQLGGQCALRGKGEKNQRGRGGAVLTSGRICEMRAQCGLETRFGSWQHVYGI